MSFSSWWQRIRKRPEPSEQELREIVQGMESIRDDVAPREPPPQEP